MFMGVLLMGAGCLKALALTKLKSAGCFLGFGFQTALAFACFRRGFLVQGEEEGGAAAVVVAAFVAVCRIDGFV